MKKIMRGKDRRFGAIPCPPDDEVESLPVSGGVVGELHHAALRPLAWRLGLGLGPRGLLLNLRQDVDVHISTYSAGSKAGKLMG